MGALMTTTLDPQSSGNIESVRTAVAESYRQVILPKISVVIPTMNEECNVGWVLDRLPACIYEVIVVDGRSSDNTVDVVRARRPDARIVLQPARGKGAAVAAGLLAVTGDIAVMIDADGSMDPAEISSLVGAL